MIAANQIESWPDLVDEHEVFTKFLNFEPKNFVLLDFQQYNRKTIKFENIFISANC